ncbi:hypothetical protein KXR83_05860 [Williamsia muralis]|uniref:hypothetical protein n=1 Tax=Williamsia marianensis TaxID=85044 RepID=UPI003F157424
MFISAALMIRTGAPTVVHDNMGAAAGTSWILTLGIAPVTCFVGAMLKNRYWGVGLQMAANVAITFAVFAYTGVLLPYIWLNIASFAVWMSIALGLMTLLISVRDGRKLVGFEQKAAAKKESCE